MDNIVCSKLKGNDNLVDIVGLLISPVLPEEDSSLPYLCYFRIDTQETMTLAGPVRPAQYTYGIDYWSFTQAECRTIADEVYVALGNWDDGEIQASQRTSDTMISEERGFHGQQTYVIWY